MKRQVLFMLLWLLSGPLLAQYDIHFLETGLDDALARSRMQRKPVFFMGYATWCTHCKTMKEQVFTDSAVANFYNQQFICVRMDMEKGEGPSLSKKFGVRSYPTFIFFDTTGKRIYQAVGEFKPADFISEGKNAMTPEKQLPYLKQQYETDLTDSDKCYQYLRALRHANLEVDELMTTYFATQREDQLLTLMNWKIISLGVTDPRSREIQFVLTHQQEYAALSTPAKVERKIYLTAAGAIQPAADNNDTLTYFKNRTLVAGWHQYKVDSLIFNLDLMVYENHNDYNKYRQTALAGTRKYSWNDYSQLRHIADVFLKQFSDTSSLNEAAAWASRSAELQPEYGNTLLYAKLLERTGNQAGARQAAEKAVTIASRSNANTTEATQLLNRLGH